MLSGAGSNIGSLTRVIVGLTEEGGAGVGAEAMYDAITEWATTVKGMVGRCRLTLWNPS
jgi:hypothetical protein